ncbi:MAG TPA: twin-arginine translocase TatA/TatE family subunit [Tepidiformaceae bacterium]|nr:twin-arginine translocase TatA/TatE family subunit [Tepidiformaceae bacterium]HSE44217.1 twin-arginine translocase TatA/TatE family subunit [Gemmatimonadales bacterium]
MFGSLGAPELLIIGAIILLLFGVGKVSGLGRELGSSIKEFRRAVKDEDEKPPQAPPVQQSQQYTPPPQQQYVPPQQQYTPPPQQPPSQQGEGKNPNIF